MNTRTYNVRTFQELGVERANVKTVVLGNRI